MKDQLGLAHPPAPVNGNEAAAIGGLGPVERAKFRLASEEFHVCQQVIKLCVVNIIVDDSSVDLWQSDGFAPEDYHAFRDVREVEPGHAFGVMRTGAMTPSAFHDGQILTKMAIMMD